MKTLILTLGLSFFTSVLWADKVWKSSNTATADTTKSLCGTGRGIIHGARVNTGAAGTLTIYNSRASATLPVAAINTAALASLDFDVLLSSGVTYTNSATANVTLLYDCY